MAKSKVKVLPENDEAVEVSGKQTNVESYSVGQGGRAASRLGAAPEGSDVDTFETGTDDGKPSPRLGAAPQ